MDGVLMLFHDKVHDQFICLDIHQLRSDADLWAGHDIIGDDVFDQLFRVFKEMLEKVFAGLDRKSVV